jgi:hypothetical protein
VRDERETRQPCGRENAEDLFSEPNGQRRLTIAIKGIHIGAIDNQFL